MIFLKIFTVLYPRMQGLAIISIGFENALRSGSTISQECR